MNNLRQARNFALSFTSFVFSAAILVGLIAVLAASGRRLVTSAAPPPSPPAKARKTMRSFASDEELKSYLRKLVEEQRRESRRGRLDADDKAPASPATTANQAAGLAKEPQSKDEAITNTQHAGVDEGGIVKLHGDHLVVLRRGRLFTVAIGDNTLKPISTVDAFGPDIDPGATWYDELLVSENTVVVIGYSYQRGGTEVGLFRIDSEGNLAYRATYHFRSDDYYASRNYATRLIGNKLIFYSPLFVLPESEFPASRFPAVRKWHKGAK